MDRPPRSVTVTYGVIILNIAIWITLGLIIALDLHPGMPGQPLVKGVMTILSFAAAGVLFGIYLFLRKHNRIAYYFALAFFGVSVIVTFFDDVGRVDLAFVVFSLVPIVLLIKDRGWYLHTESNSPAM